MRFWIVLLSIVAFLGFAWWHYFGSEEQTETAKQVENVAALAKHPLGEAIGDGTPEQRKRVIRREFGRRAILFRHRPVPSVDTIQSLIGRSRGTSDKGVQKYSDTVETQPEQIMVSVDAETNTVLLMGDKERVTLLAELVKTLDQVVSTCHLKSWIVFVKGDKQAGYDLVARLVTGGGNGNTAMLGGGIFTAAADLGSLQLSLQAGASRGVLEIVDEPYMQLIQARRSVIATGQEIAIASTTVNQGVSQTNVDFKQVGMSLAVTPYFLEKERVRLVVEQKNDVVGSTIQIDGNPVPEISTQSLKTSVEMRLGNVLVLGGVESAKRETRRGWLTRKDERAVGHLYVVAAIYSTIPKAVPALDVGEDFPLHPSRPHTSPRAWLDQGNILPTREQEPGK